MSATRSPSYLALYAVPLYSRQTHVAFSVPFLWYSVPEKID
jgi:hypothetical protein